MQRIFKVEGPLNLPEAEEMSKEFMWLGLKTQLVSDQEILLV